MPVLKCKMCGGDIIFSGENAVGKCDCCGCTTTLPKTDDEKVANLFNRANHFRRLGEFDKASSSYERILEEDSSIAEAYWGVVLCRYGIEYVEDPDSHERIPTCHRANYDSILMDADYHAALQFAAPAARPLYEAEATRIDEIQKGILSISKCEAPYDIFISYKESTDGGSRTKDSVLAQDIYYKLTKEGYRVFFSRITLEDKIGQQYEPYIFSALNSAKVMLVIGTDPDNFNAPWVRNEWSRFLAILKKETGRLLIPCYRDMDAYDLPEELSVFQCQDMSKIGFEQDLIRGIKKAISTSQASSALNSGTAPSVESLLKRGQMFLSDCAWDSATNYFNRVLDINPECAEAYLGLLCAAFGAPSLSVLGTSYVSRNSKTLFPEIPDKVTLLSDNLNYQKAFHFGNPSLQRSLQDQDDIAVKKFKMYITSNKEDLEKDLIQAQSEIDNMKEKLNKWTLRINDAEGKVERFEQSKKDYTQKHSKKLTTVFIILAAITIFIFLNNVLYGILVGAICLGVGMVWTVISQHENAEYDKLIQSARKETSEIKYNQEYQSLKGQEPSLLDNIKTIQERIKACEMLLNSLE